MSLRPGPGGGASASARRAARSPPDSSPSQTFGKIGRRMLVVVSERLAHARPGPDSDRPVGLCETRSVLFSCRRFNRGSHVRHDSDSGSQRLLRRRGVRVSRGNRHRSDAAPVASWFSTMPAARGSTRASRPAEDGYQIRDLGSTNGVKVNGKKAESSPLLYGDRFSLGRNLFIFLGDVTNSKSKEEDGRGRVNAPTAASSTPRSRSWTWRRG